MLLSMIVLDGLAALATRIASGAVAALAAVGLALIIGLMIVFVVSLTTLGYDAIVGVRRIGQLRWRRDSFYTPRHLWLRPLRGQLVRVGVDEIGARVLPDVAAISLVGAGARVAAGQPLATIQCADGSVVLRSPVSGTIARANSRLEETPGLLTRDACRRAWLVDIKPHDGLDVRWLSGRRARAWLADEQRRLTAFLEGNLGMAAADGGELIRTAPMLLTRDQRRALRNAFLNAPAGVGPTA